MHDQPTAPNRLSGSGGDNAPSAIAVGSGRRLRVLPLLVAGILLGIIGAMVYSRATGTTVPPVVPGLLQSAIQAVAGAEPEERIVFSASPTPPALSPDLLPAGVPMIYCFYDVPSVKKPGSPVVTLSRDGKKTGQVPAADIVAGSRPGVGTLTLKAQGGFQAGIYEVELQFADSRVLASFVAAQKAEAILGQATPRDAEVAISPPVFASGVGADGKPRKPQTAFGGQDKVFFVFQFDQAEPGSAVQVKWYGGQERIESATHEVLLPSVKGWAHAWLQAPAPGLPPGRYRAAINMSSDPHELASAEFTITPNQSASPPSGAPNSPPRR